MAKKKRIWTKEELTIAYYIGKYGYAGLKISEHDFVEYIIGETTVPSLKMQIANFRFLLGIEGFQLEHASQAMKDIVDEFSNLTIVQVRRKILNYVEQCDEKITICKHKENNKIANKKRDELNAQSQKNFENKMAAMSKYRRLRKIDKK